MKSALCRPLFASIADSPMKSKRHQAEVTDDAKLSFIGTFEMIASLTKIAGSPALTGQVEASFEGKTYRRASINLLSRSLNCTVGNCVYFRDED